MVHEPVDAATHQAPAGDDDVAADKEGDDGVEPQPAGPDDEQHAGDDPDSRDEVGHQVLAVGLEGDRVVSTTGADEDHRDRAIDEGRDDRDRQTDADLLESCALEGTTFPSPLSGLWINTLRNRLVSYETKTGLDMSVYFIFLNPKI